MKKQAILRTARALLTALHTLPEKDQAGAITPFLKELQSQRKLPPAPFFMSALERVWKESFGAKTLYLTTAHRLSPAVKERFTEMVPQGEVKAVIDPRLIGGAVLRVDDRILDASITGALERMRKTLM